MPFDITDLSTRITDDHVLYGGKLSLYSNFYTMGYYFIIDKQQYNCVEQYYQHAKAVFAEDKTAAINIMHESDPAEMKRIGDTLTLVVKGSEWKDIMKGEMFQAVYAKFSQTEN